MEWIAGGGRAGAGRRHPYLDTVRVCFCVVHSFASSSSNNNSIAFGMVFLKCYLIVVQIS